MNWTVMACTIDLVVKFGGSAITVKDQLETLQPDVLARAARLIRSCLKEKLTCVVVHGAGSFGHHHAKQYNVQKGWSHLTGDTEAVELVKHGFSRCRQSVTKLHKLVQDALLQEDVPAVGLSCCGMWQTTGGSVIQHNVEGIRDLVTAGFVPVLHGDGVLDAEMGCAILSGDTIIQTICQECRVGRVVFLTCVDGVYNKSPENNSDALLYRTIQVSTTGHMISTTTTSDTSNDFTKSEICKTQSSDVSKVTSGVRTQSDDNRKVNDQDVTGGMALKFNSAINIVTNSEGRTHVFVCKAGTTSGESACLYGCLDERDKLGTVITLQT